jgi:fructoselysine and glucoselysine-specific PTS system IIA component
MNRIILASHGGLSAGMKDTVQMILGELPNLYVLATLRDETEPITVAARRLLEDFAAEDVVYIVTDVMGGSVNNEFTLVAQSRPGTHLVTNMNLPLLIQLLFAEEGRDTAEVIREICAADDTRVKYVNDLLDASVKEAPGFGDDF